MFLVIFFLFLFRWLQLTLLPLTQSIVLWFFLLIFLGFLFFISNVFTIFVSKTKQFFKFTSASLNKFYFIFLRFFIVEGFFLFLSLKSILKKKE